MLLVASVLTACVPREDADTGAPAETAAPADTAADSGPDTDTDTDTDDTAPPAPEGLLHYVGSATVLERYDGTETVVFADDQGDLCRVALTLASTAARTDCGECDWAYDVAVVDAVTELDVACAAVGWEDPSVAIGTTRGYGYVALYFGHAPVLMVEADGAWDPDGYAEWDAETGAFAYDRDDGYHPY